MYNGSTCDSGQMANGQSVCRPGPGPTANWLEIQSKQHQHQQQQQKQDCEPVAARVMTNGTCDPSERYDNYIRPFGNNQPEPACPAHLAFLYDRVQKPVEWSAMAACPNGMTSPHSDEYRSLSRAVPAPVHQHHQQASTAARTPSEASSEYNPFSRATPAPIQQHAAAVAQRPPASGTPTSPRTTQHGNSEPRAAEVQ